MFLPAYSCTLAADETLEHLFIHCSFAQGCWASIGLHVGHDGPFDTLEQLKVQLGVPFFMDIIIVMSWCICLEKMILFLGESKQLKTTVYGTSRSNLP